MIRHKKYVFLTDFLAQYVMMTPNAIKHLDSYVLRLSMSINVCSVLEKNVRITTIAPIYYFVNLMARADAM